METLPLKIVKIKESFSDCASKEMLYQRIIDWGKRLKVLDDRWKTEENRVSGCQSILYLHASHRDGLMYFSAASDALISSGLAALLIEAYSGENPETILTSTPTFFEEIGIASSLTPGRANGFASLFFKMQQTSVPYLLAPA